MRADRTDRIADEILARVGTVDGEATPALWGLWFEAIPFVERDPEAAAAARRIEGAGVDRILVRVCIRIAWLLHDRALR